MNSVFKNVYPRQVWTNNDCCKCNQHINNQDQRLGGFLFPFIAGAAVSAPFWFVAGSNKSQNNFYPYPAQYQYYPVYPSNYPNQSYPINFK